MRALKQKWLSDIVDGLKKCKPLAKHAP
jgi:hypothetical protein